MSAAATVPSSTFQFLRLALRHHTDTTAAPTGTQWHCSQLQSGLITVTEVSKVQVDCKTNSKGHETINGIGKQTKPLDCTKIKFMLLDASINHRL